MTLALEAGNWSELAAAYEGGLAAGRVCMQQGLMIDHLSGIGIFALMFGRLQSVLNAHIPEPTLRACLAATDRQLSLLPPRDFAIKGERLYFLDVVQRTHTDDGRGSGRLIPSAASVFVASSAPSTSGALSWLSSGSPLLDWFSIAYPSKAATTARGNEFLDGMEARARLAPFERAGAFDPDSFLSTYSSRYFLLAAISHLDRTLQCRDSFDLESAGVRLLLAIHIYRAGHGELPQSLSDLVPDILPSLPPDPFTGRDFVYRRIDPGADPLHRAFILYSTGFDGIDNGGKAPPNITPKAEFPQGKGFDYVVNGPH
jgi:hypothetical protein